MTTLLGAMALGPQGISTSAPGPTSAGGNPKAEIGPVPGSTFHLEGWIGAYLEAVSGQWLKVVPASNPAILEMFRDRDRKPPRDLLCWSGEFAGKYLTASTQVYRLTGDPALGKVIRDFVLELIPLQTPAGYLGPWPKGFQLTGHAINNQQKSYKTWDAWDHYHIMIGLLLWSDISGDQAALACARRIGDLICSTFARERLVDIGSTEMNLAPIHSLCLLFRRTGHEPYLRMAEKIREEFAATDAQGLPLAGDYLYGPLAGKEFFQLPRPRWESLHSIMGLAELYQITGDVKSRQAVEKIWWSIARWDRHNNGGFSSGEQACGNPYDQRPIETCCTIAWSALSVEMLRLTGDPVVADELELSLLNSVTGMHSPSGRWATYNTPMDGVRKASAHDIVFQAREGSPELNCCSVNSARGFGLVSEWAVMRSPEGINLNWYGPGSISVPLEGDRELLLQQTTAYPRENRVSLKIGLREPAQFSLRLRIPHWSHQTRIQLNSTVVSGVEPGRYLELTRTWSPGDVLNIEFDFSLQYWAGERECEGKVSIYRGPILLTYDRRFNEFDPGQVPPLSARNLSGKMVSFDGWLPPMMLMEFATINGETLRLCDFGSAGMGGSPYHSWLEVTGCTKTEFFRQNTRRSSPVI